MNLQLVYDPSTASAPAEFFQDLNQIVSYLDAAIPNPATITIRVGYGEINDVPIVALANSNYGSLIPVTYAQLQGVVSGLPTTDPNAGTQYYLPEAQAALLGLAPSDAHGAIGFNNTVQWNYDHSATTGTFDFVGAAFHEITEVLGRFDLFEGFVNAVTEYDAFRVHSGGNAYFSLDGGHTLINEFSTIGDPGDWIQQDDSFTAKSTIGHEFHFSEGDLLAIDSLYGIHRTPEVFADQPGSIAVTVENAMYGVVGTQAETAVIANQFLPGQLAFANTMGFNSNVYGAQVVAEAFTFGNENGSHAWEAKYGPSAIPNTVDGDHQFAVLVASNVFGASASSGTTDVVATWVANWKAFFTDNHLFSTPDQIDQAARASAFGDAVGVIIDSNLNGAHDLASNFVHDAAHGIAVYGAPLALQAEYNPLLMV
jgi:hypothetical protein